MMVKTLQLNFRALIVDIQLPNEGARLASSVTSLLGMMTASAKKVFVGGHLDGWLGSLANYDGDIVDVYRDDSEAYGSSYYYFKIINSEGELQTVGPVNMDSGVYYESIILTEGCVKY